MKITAIKAQVKNPNRVSVFVDEKYAFSLEPSQLIELKVRVGLEIDEPGLVSLKKASDFGKAYERALAYAFLRPRSVKELRDYCWRKKWATEDCDLIVQKLVERGYVDDVAFARSWVESRRLRAKTSERSLRLELKRKGITDDIIRASLENSDFNDPDILRQVIAKKGRLSRYRDDPQKFTQYLVRQGFSYDDVKNALG